MHHLDFFLTGVTGNVNAPLPSIDDLRSELIEVVYGVPHAALISWNRVAEMMTVSPGMMDTFYAHYCSYG